MHKEWLEFAAMDLDSAQFLLGMRPVPVEIICYHCEQAAEKLLKAVLVAADVEPPKTHDLIQLCKKCAELDEEYEALADACIELSPYGVQVRYPSNLDLNEDDMQCALNMCRCIDAAVCDVTRSVSKMTEIERRGGKRWDKPKKVGKSRDCRGGKF